MYYWRIWREKRVLFFALLILGLVICWPVSVKLRVDVVAGGYKVGQVPPAQVASWFWREGMEVLGFAAGIAVYFIGLLAGCGGIGEEVERGSAAFLLTRPRSRGYFVWSFWLTGILEVLAFTLTAMLSSYAVLFYDIHRPGPRNFLLLAPALMITGLLAIGLVNLFSTASRRATNAVGGGVAFAVVYLILAFVTWGLQHRHMIGFRLPTPLDLYHLNWNAALASTMLGWLAVSVALVGVSHWIVVRLEV
jgi:ABC-type transport system involved in multi-copper enzyme maturation permease subunit